MGILIKKSTFPYLLIIENNIKQPLYYKTTSCPVLADS